MDAFEILVVVLSVTLAVLLVAVIVMIVAVTKLVNKLRQISDKAEEIVDDVESVSNFFKKTAGPVAITGLIGNIVAKVSEYTKEKKGKK